ncbi:carbonic anhydrase family protein [Nonomuraea typhae]|uniref:carbonic anhydrase family protein n=1 Tax=Nonomuraea typhae TaxID=2603600 RepID=UPI0012F8F87A|nr:carbonic anhydrase family protein [Nonomuraea typhae]
MRINPPLKRFAQLVAAGSVVLLTVPATAQAQTTSCPGPGTDTAVETPVVINPATACPDTAQALKIAYAPRVDGTLTLDDKDPHGGEPSEHDDIRFTPSPNTNSYVVFNKKTYILKNVHYHGPAEHKIAGQPDFSPLEAHLVHELDGPELGYVVLSVLVNPAKAKSEHDRLLHEPPTTPGASKNVQGVSLKALLPPQGSRAYYRYKGSLTTPDASHVYYKPVNWFVFKRYGTATPENIAAVHALWPEGNKRELQNNPVPPNIYRH